MAATTNQRGWSRCQGVALLVLLVAAAVHLQPAAGIRIGDSICAILGNYNYLSRLTVMGDSNSDTGDAAFASYSFFKQTGLPDPTYNPGGRFSGGLVWTDYVNQCLAGGVRSYAVAFGTMCGANGFRNLTPTFPYVPVLSIEDQVTAFAANTETKPVGRATLLWAAPNDMAAALFNDPDGPTGPQPSYLDTHTDEVINGIIDCTVHNIMNLIKNGERNFVVMNMQPLHLAWVIRDLDKAAPGFAARLGGYITTYNDRLATRISKLRLPSGSFADLLDIYTPIKNALTGVVPVPGITDLVNRCLPINDTFGLLEIPTPLVGPVCSNPLEAANWDSTHLNTVVHKEVIAKTVIDFLKRKSYICVCNA